MQVQRTILWVVFSMSLLFLWDSWQKSNGKPSMFGAPTATQAQGEQPAADAGGKPDASVPAAPAGSSVPAPTAAGTGASVPVASTVSTTPAAAMLKLRNDTLALDVDPVGGQVRRA